MQKKFDLSGFHADTVKNFSRVADMCVGLVGSEWLPGEMRTFNERTRPIGEATRPLALSLEVTHADGLILSWATAHPVGGRLVFQTRGKIDFRAPIVSAGRGNQLNLDRPKHRLNCKLACDILRKIADVGYATLRGEEPRLVVPRWPTLFGHDGTQAEKVGAGSYEDYGPVLGALDRQIDIRGAADVEIVVPNPAAKILARRGIDDVEGVSQCVLDELAAEFRAELPEYELSEESVCEALLNTDAPVHVAVDIKTAVLRHPAEAAGQLRRLASGRAQREAADNELLAAALSPVCPAILSRLSKIQVATADAWQESMPAYYAGDFLSPVNWKPAFRGARVRRGPVT